MSLSPLFSSSEPAVHNASDRQPAIWMVDVQESCTMDTSQKVSPKEQWDDQVSNISKSKIVLQFFTYYLDLCECNPPVAFTGLLRKCQWQTGSSACSDSPLHFSSSVLIHTCWCCLNTEAASVLMWISEIKVIHLWRFFMLHFVYSFINDTAIFIAVFFFI